MKMRFAPITCALSVLVIVSPAAAEGESIRTPTWADSSNGPPAPSPGNGNGNGNAGQSGSSATSSAGPDSKRVEPAKPEAAEALDDLVSVESSLFGKLGTRASVFGYSASGSSLVRAGDYTALGGGIEWQMGDYGGKGPAGTYFGYELRVSAGYQAGAEFKPSLPNEAKADGALAVLGEIGPSIVPVHWGGSAFAGRIVLAPAVGLVLNGARYYEGYLYIALVGRAQFFLSPTLMLQAQYGFTPWTAKEAYSIREHRVEAALHVKSYGFGFRYQLDLVTDESGSKSAKSPTIGGFASLLF
jgi:hypothetical protein